MPVQWWNRTTMHVMLSELCREWAISVSFTAAASGSSVALISEIISLFVKRHKIWLAVDQIKRTNDTKRPRSPYRMCQHAARSLNPYGPTTCVRVYALVKKTKQGSTKPFQRQRLVLLVKTSHAAIRRVKIGTSFCTTSQRPSVARTRYSKSLLTSVSCILQYNSTKDSASDA